MYDLGRTFVATSGQPGVGNVIGDLRVTYEVELKKPVITSSVSPTTDSATVCVGPTIGTTAWFGTLASQRRITGGLAVTVNNNTLTFPKGASGYFDIVIGIAASAQFTAGDLSGAPVLANCVGVQCFPETYSSLNTYYRSVFVGGAGATEARLWYMTTVRIEDPQAVATVTFPNVAWTGTATSLDMRVSAIV